MEALLAVQHKRVRKSLLASCERNPVLTMHLQNLVMAGTAFGKEAPEGRCIPDSKTYLQQVAGSFFQWVVCFWVEGLQGQLSQCMKKDSAFAFKLFLFLTDECPGVKVFERVGDVFVAGYTDSVVQSRLSRLQATIEAEVDWATIGLFKMTSTHLQIVDSGESVPLPGMVLAEVSKWHIAENYSGYKAVLKHVEHGCTVECRRQFHGRWVDSKVANVEKLRASAAKYMQEVQQIIKGEAGGEVVVQAFQDLGRRSVAAVHEEEGSEQRTPQKQQGKRIVPPDSSEKAGTGPGSGGRASGAQGSQEQAKERVTV